MNRTSILIGKQQIKVYQDLISILKELNEVINTFDGKVINIRLTKYIKEKLNVDCAIISNYRGIKSLKIISKENRSITIHDVNGNSSTAYVEYNTIEICLQREENNRLEAKFVLQRLQDEINIIEEKIFSLNKTIINFDNMLKEYQEIKKRIEDFNNRYDYSIRERERLRF